MESGIKQNAVSFSAGMSNVPNDLLCSDDACSEVVGLTSENGEMKPIQMPRKVFSVSDEYELIYVHQIQTKRVYIYVCVENESSTIYGVHLKYNTDEDSTIKNVGGLGVTLVVSKDSVKITSVGNTLIASTNIGVNYFLWDGDGYKNLGRDIPEPNVVLSLRRSGDSYKTSGGNFSGARVVTHTSDIVDVTGLDISTGSGFGPSGSGARTETVNDLVIGCYEQCKAKAAKANRFDRPFFCRYALELYDGSYTHQSAPILMWPSITSNFYVNLVNEGGSPSKLSTTIHSYMLGYKNTTDYSNYKDIVRGVVLFVSDQVEIYDTAGDATLTQTTNKVQDGVYSDGVTWGEDVLHDSTSQETYIKGLQQRKEEDVLEELSSVSIFYKLCELGYSENFVKVPIPDHRLEVITTVERLDDDYYSHCALTPKYMYSYNGRLHLSGVSRGFFDGFTTFSNYRHSSYTPSPTPSSGVMYVKILDSQNEEVWVSRSNVDYPLTFFFYPDTRAKQAVFVSGTTVVDIPLEEHRGLNGAYALVAPTSSFSTHTKGSDESYSATIRALEPLPNKVLVSEVDNPFVFRARGYNTVGKGEVMAIASNTAALSEGQFGQFPLYAFATDGIWALGTNATGTYSTVAPMSREVCNNPDSVTQTDSAVFFTSEKGLMVVAGSKVQCVSEQLNGKTETWGYTAGKWELVNGQNVFKPIVFKEFLSGCTIAYDYRDSLLWLLNKDYRWYYVFNIKSGTWALAEANDDDSDYLRTVSDYPDTLLQDEDGWVSTLLGRLDQNDDNMYYIANITTRPMKFGNALTLKSIREVKHLAMMGSQAEVQIRLYASNDCRQWVEVRSLRGKPWKYYRVKYHLSRMLPTDRFIGTVFRVKETRDNKLR